LKGNSELIGGHVGTNITYEKAPLVELIVEVRWPVKTIPISGGPPIVHDPSAVFDLWSQQLTGALHKEGFQALERLIPHDIPAIAHQPVYRYSKPGERERFPICQFGHGIFTINAGPPNYESWESFRPTVLAGLKALAGAKPAESDINAFQGTSLRYIDSFNEELRNGLPNYLFMRDELGVTISMPQKLLLEMAKGESAITPTIAFKMPLAKDDNATLTFQVAQGRIGRSTDSATIMDMSYAVSGSVSMDCEETIQVLDRGHDVLHEWFDTLTENIADRMKPVAHG
jgi:uncharacterized protein (TIGR04255 family)